MDTRKGLIATQRAEVLCNEGADDGDEGTPQRIAKENEDVGDIAQHSAPRGEDVGQRDLQRNRSIETREQRVSEGKGTAKKRRGKSQRCCERCYCKQTPRLGDEVMVMVKLKVEDEVNLVSRRSQSYKRGG